MTDDNPNNKAESIEPYAWVVVGILLISQFVMSVGAYSWGPLAPFFRDEFNISNARIGMVTSSLYLTATIIAIPSGMLIDKLGAHIMLILCLAIMGIAFWIMPLAGQFTWIIACAGLAGIGYGVINQVSTKGIMHWFTSKTRATAMGVKQMGVTLGGAVAAALLPAMTLAYGWRKGVFVIGAAMVLIAIISIFLYKEQPGSKSPVNPAEAKAAPSPKTSKISLMEVMANPVLLIVMLIVPFMAFSQICIASFMVLYLNETLDFSVAFASSFLSIAMIAGTLGRVGWGLISDRVFGGDRIKPSFILSIIGALSVFAFALLDKNSPICFFYILSVLIGFTLIGWNAVLMTLVAELAGTEKAASVMGIMVTIAWAGIVIGPAVFGYIADKFSFFSGWVIVSLISFLTAFGFIYISIKIKKKESLTSPPTT